MDSLLRLPEVLARFGLCRSSLYNRIANGLWTHQVRLSTRAVGWLASEVQALLGARVASKTEDQIRELVIKLEATRASRYHGRPGMKVDEGDSLLTTEEVAARLRVSVETLATWRCTRQQHIPYVKIGRLVRYRASDLETYLSSRRRDHLSADVVALVCPTDPCL